MSNPTQSRRLRRLKAKGRTRCETWIPVGTGLMSPMPPVYVCGENNRGLLIKRREERKNSRRRQDYGSVTLVSRSELDGHLHEVRVLNYWFGNREPDSSYACPICNSIGFESEID